MRAIIFGALLFMTFQFFLYGLQRTVNIFSYHIDHPTPTGCRKGAC